MNLFEKSGRSSGGEEVSRWKGKLRYIPIAVIVFFLALGGERGIWGDSGSGSDLPGETAEEIISTENGIEETEEEQNEDLSSSDADRSNSEDSEKADSGTDHSNSEDSEKTEEFSSDSVSGEELSTADSIPESTAAALTVYVCGYVRYPGVYTLMAGDRVTDAVGAAGVFLEEADTEYWNLAELLSDGEQIRIPSEEESESMEARETTVSASAGNSGNISGESRNGTGGSVNPDSGSGSSEGGGLVNLNTADAAELMTLTGIGESRAQAIIAYREENGPFQSIEDIMNVSGIKEGSFAKIKDYICVQ